MRAPAARGPFFYVRISLLSLTLIGVLLYAYRDISGRRERTEWTRTLNVAIVVLRLGPVTEDAILALSTRAPALASRLEDEFRRHRPGAHPPFRFDVFGPADVVRAPPDLAGDGLIELVRHNYDLFRYRRSVDRDLGLPASAYDSVIYLVVVPPSHGGLLFVEGESQQGGTVGIVRVSLDETMVDFALFVVAHELFHTLGATDKYDASGRALVPEGLADPDRDPASPQDGVELMARNRPVGGGSEASPEALSELHVNRFTAAEIGWVVR